jgi:Spy/CpxP family protein refolding chaperone
MTIVRIIVATTAVLFVLGAPAHAQNPRQEVKEKIRALRMTRVIDALALDEAGVARLMPIMNHAYDQIGEVTRDTGEARRELRALIGPSEPDAKPDEARINALLDRILANKLRVEQIENGMMTEVRKVLTPTQMGRLVVVLPEINHQIQQQIRSALGKNGPEMGPPGNKDGGKDDPF